MPDREASQHPVANVKSAPTRRYAAHGGRCIFPWCVATAANSNLSTSNRDAITSFARRPYRLCSITGGAQTRSPVVLLPGAKAFQKRMHWCAVAHHRNPVSRTKVRLPPAEILTPRCCLLRAYSSRRWGGGLRPPQWRLCFFARTIRLFVQFLWLFAVGTIPSLTAPRTDPTCASTHTASRFGMIASKRCIG